MRGPLQALWRMVHGMAARCVLRLVNDGLMMQAVQVGLLADETADDIERVQNYGMTSVPLPGAEGVCLFLGGDRAHGVIIAMDDRRYRLKGLKGGEVALYTDEGDSIVLKRGHEIHVTTDTWRNSGVVISEGDVIAGGVSLMHHTHSGVQPGGGSTSQPNGGA